MGSAQRTTRRPVAPRDQQRLRAVTEGGSGIPMVRQRTSMRTPSSRRETTCPPSLGGLPHTLGTVHHAGAAIHGEAAQRDLVVSRLVLMLG
jgi:hypothetical protein